MREGRSKSREKRSTNAGVDRPGPGGGGGRHAEGASLAAAEDRQPWTGQRQKMKSEAAFKRSLHSIGCLAGSKLLGVLFRQAIQVARA